MKKGKMKPNKKISRKSKGSAARKRLEEFNSTESQNSNEMNEPAPQADLRRKRQSLTYSRKSRTAVAPALCAIPRSSSSADFTSNPVLGMLQHI